MLLYLQGLPCLLRSPAISGIGNGSFRRSFRSRNKVFGWGLFFDDKTYQVCACGAGMARSRCGGRSCGARESRSKSGHSNTDSDVQTQSDTTTIIGVLHNNKDVCVCDTSCCITVRMRVSAHCADAFLNVSFSGFYRTGVRRLRPVRRQRTLRGIRIKSFGTLFICFRTPVRRLRPVRS